MIVETKYNLGHTVWPITRIDATEPTPCNACEDLRWVMLGGERLLCPKCHGYALSPHIVGQRWAIDERAPGTIGDIRTRRAAEKCGGHNENVYMLDSTGVGSGTLWQEDRLWPSLEEAKAECDRLNEGRPA